MPLSQFVPPQLSKPVEKPPSGPQLLHEISSTAIVWRFRITPFGSIKPDIAAALKYCRRDPDPSLGVRNVEPKPRQAVWNHGEVISLCKTAFGAPEIGAWRSWSGVAWDTSLLPVDVSIPGSEDSRGDAFELFRAKTGRAAIGTLSRRSVRILDGYLADLGAEVVPGASIFRNR